MKVTDLDQGKVEPIFPRPTLTLRGNQMRQDVKGNNSIGTLEPPLTL